MTDQNQPESSPQIIQMNQTISMLNEHNQALNESYLESLNVNLQQKAQIIRIKKELKESQEALEIAKKTIIDLKDKYTDGIPFPDTKEEENKATPPLDAA